MKPREAPVFPKYTDYLDDDDAAPPSKKAAKKKAKQPELPADPFDTSDLPKPSGRKNKVTTSMRETYSLDNRVLKKKERKKLAVSWSGANRHKATDVFFKRQVEEARKKFGNSAAFIGSETNNLVIGIPCPSLAVEYVIAQDCFPLGLVIQLVAKYGVGKSALAAEFIRWFDMAGGGGHVVENETKFNPEWYRSILLDIFDRRVLLHRSNSLEDWQRKLTFAVKNTQRDMDGTAEKPGPGRTIPVAFVVDSVMGKQSEEIQAGILGKKTKKGKKGGRGTTGLGHATRSHPIEAQIIAKYMRTIPQVIDGWPFALILINHLRVNKDEAGNQVRQKGGGEQLNFQESFELELQKVGGHKKKIESVDFEGFPVQISCEKNSFGPTHRKIQSRILWWYVKNEETGKREQHTVWDWDWSTVHMLSSLMDSEYGNPRVKKSLKDMDFHLSCPSSADVTNLAWSKTLGMKEKDALPWTEVGAMIREDGKLMVALRDALNITHRPLLHGDYLDQIERLRKKMP